MYTEILVRAEIKEDAPTLVKQVLEYLFNGGDKPDQEPDDPFFKCKRWEMIGRSPPSVGNSPMAACSNGRLISVSELRNYKDEVRKFFKWVNPYLDEPVSKCIGYSWHEMAMQPDLHYKVREG